MDYTMEVFIVDDEQRALDSLSKLLTNFFEHIKILGTALNVDDAYSQILQKKPQLIFLDIEMGKESGFNLLEKFEEIDFHIVFLTAHEEYALRAIKFSAIDYIIKPAGISDLKTLFQKISNNPIKSSDNQNIKHMFGNFLTKDKSEHEIALPVTEGIEFIKVNDIISVIADGSYTHFSLRSKNDLTVSKNLKFFESILTEYGFFRIHNSTLINLKYIKIVGKSSGGYVVMENDVEYSISKSRKEEFMKVLSV
ncbi:MAG: response regulator transcription factor [Bacteroidetes bacterium]|nr:response regulator transcription factor [Bacteroidota bacterium]